MPSFDITEDAEGFRFVLVDDDGSQLASGPPVADAQLARDGADAVRAAVLEMDDSGDAAGSDAGPTVEDGNEGLTYMRH